MPWFRKREPIPITLLREVTLLRKAMGQVHMELVQQRARNAINRETIMSAISDLKQALTDLITEATTDLQAQLDKINNATTDPQIAAMVTQAKQATADMHTKFSSTIAAAPSTDTSAAAPSPDAGSATQPTLPKSPGT